jgi:glycosyltransferase involved in cell wall biosynthesis
MRLIETLLVRDELDVIRDHLEFHLSQGVDFIIATDNGSKDGTRDILADYEKRGAVFVIDEPPSDFSQGRWVTRMARLAYDKYNADWVVNADADEFFVPEIGNIRSALKSIADNVNVIKVNRHDFVPIIGKTTQETPRTMIFRKVHSVNLAGKPLPPKAVHRGRGDVNVGAGNHKANFPDVREIDSTALSVYHYPIRSGAQIETKVRNKGEGYARNTKLSPQVGFHSRYWYELLSKGLLEDEFNRHAINYELLNTKLNNKELVKDETVANYLSHMRG